MHHQRLIKTGTSATFSPPKPNVVLRHMRVRWQSANEGTARALKIQFKAPSGDVLVGIDGGSVDSNSSAVLFISPSTTNGESADSFGILHKTIPEFYLDMQHSIRVFDENEESSSDTCTIDAVWSEQ